MANSKHENLVDNYVHTRLTALKLEADEELKNYSCADNASCHRLEGEGMALCKMSISSYSTSDSGMLTIIYKNSQKKNFGTHIITEGDPVTVVVMGESDITERRHLDLQGVVDKVLAGMISINFTDISSLRGIDNNLFAIIKVRECATYERMRNAVVRLKEAPQETEHLTNIFFGNAPLEQVPIPPLLLDTDGSLKYCNPHLHQGQKEAVSFALQQKHFAVIHGPPGTGKTTTLVELIVQLTRAGENVLVCAPSNVAVDNICSKTALYVPKVIRLGHLARISPENRKYSADARYATGFAAEGLLLAKIELRSELDRLPLDFHSKWERRQSYTKLRQLRAEIYRRECKLSKEAALGAKCCFVTLGSGHKENLRKYFPEGHFTTVIIDECSQALEPACWIVVPQAKRCIVAGDHEQLAPVILSRDAKYLGLDMTLMERGIRLPGTTCFRLLTHQYRMHELIMTWVSMKAYESQLTADISVAHHLLKNLPGVEEKEITGTPLLLIDTSGFGYGELASFPKLPAIKSNKRGQKGETNYVSYCNDEEANVVILVIQELISGGVRPDDIGVITPYNRQVDLIKEKLEDREILQIEVSTVDGFQGREKEAVIVTLVRSNPEGNVGFLADERRLNVAVSRARRFLCVIADCSTVKSDETCHSLLTYMNSEGLTWSAHALKSELERSVPPPQITEKATAASKKAVDKLAFDDVGEDEHNTTNTKTINVLRALQNFISSDEETLTLSSQLAAFDRLKIHAEAASCGLHHMLIEGGDSRSTSILIEKSDVSLERSKQNVGVERYRTLVRQCAATGGIVKFTTHLSNFEMLCIQEEAERLGLDYVAVGYKGGQTQITVTEKQVVPAKPFHRDTPSQYSVAQRNPFSCLADDNTVSETTEEALLLVPDVGASNNSSNNIATASGAIPKRNIKKHKKGEKPSRQTEDLTEGEKLLDELAKELAQCSAVHCKVSVKLIGHNCPFCKKRYCISHSLPEVHGCEVDAKRAARKDFVRPSPKPLSSDEKKKLRQVLEKRLSAKSDMRKGGKKK